MKQAKYDSVILKTRSFTEPHSNSSLYNLSNKKFNIYIHILLDFNEFIIMYYTMGICPANHLIQESVIRFIIEKTNLQYTRDDVIGIYWATLSNLILL